MSYEEKEAAEVTDDEVDPEAVAALNARDAGFVLRLALRIAVVGLLGAWIALKMTDGGLGDWVASGFRALAR